MEWPAPVQHAGSHGGIARQAGQVKGHVAASLWLAHLALAILLLVLLHLTPALHRLFVTHARTHARTQASKQGRCE